MSNDLFTGCREVNETWLKGWGCEVRHLGFCVLARHPDFAEFNALYDLSSPSDLVRVLAVAEREFPSGCAVYVPNSPQFEDCHATLTQMGYLPAFRTQTLAAKAQAQPGPSGHRVGLAAVEPGSFDLWGYLYQKNFAISPGVMAADRARWRALMQSTPAAHFFLVTVSGEPIGTVQLVAPGNRCCGIYGLSIAPQLRSVTLLGRVHRELAIAGARLDSDWVCFDRLRPARGRTGRPTRQQFRWRRLELFVVSSDTGYRAQ